jgi:hypothetical protein
MRATIDFTDPRGTKNFYLWDQYVDGVRLIAADSSFRYRVVGADDFLNGTEVTGFQPYDGIAVAPGQEVLVRQLGISEDAYRYYSALSEQTTNDGSPFGVPSASLRGNVTNLTSAAHFPLGYFIAGEVAEARARLPGG